MVDVFFVVFVRREKEVVEIFKRLCNELDEDGFVIVMRGGRNVLVSRFEVEEVRKKMIEWVEKKR